MWCRNTDFSADNCNMGHSRRTIFVLDGLGTSAAFTSQTVQVALRDAQSPLGHVVLLSCHAALLQEFSSLSADEMKDTGVDIQCLKDPLAVLDVPPSLRTNTLVAIVNLYLTQILRFLAHTEAGHLDARTCGYDNQYEVLGFSTGLLAAAVITTSTDIPTLIFRAVEALRLGFWLGFHSQRFTSAAIKDLSASSDSSPWSLLTFGSSREEMREAIDRYNAEHVSQVAQNAIDAHRFFRETMRMCFSLPLPTLSASLSQADRMLFVGLEGNIYQRQRCRPNSSRSMLCIMLGYSSKSRLT